MLLDLKANKPKSFNLNRNALDENLCYVFWRVLLPMQRC